MTFRILLSVALLAFSMQNGPAYAQQRDFDTLPDRETIRSLLLPPSARNIVSPESGESLVTRPDTGTATELQSSRPRPNDRPKPIRREPNVTCMNYGETNYLSARIQFEINSTAVHRRYQPGIAALAEVMRGEPGLTLRVVGHTDVSGGDEINLPLSVARARSVVELLVRDHGIDSRRFTIEGRGSSRLCLPARPLSPANRRVTFSRG